METLSSVSFCLKILLRKDFNFHLKSMSYRAITKSNGTIETIPMKVCGFCKRNGELPMVYESHILRDSEGKLVCPNLRRHKCELCGATGDEAHTRSYCAIAQLGRTDPLFRELFPPTAGKTFNNMVALKKTRFNSAGKLRRRY